MNNNRLNRWLTLGANIGVLFGIILLVIELEQNRQMIRAQTRNDISQQLSNRLSLIANDVNASSVHRRARNGEELTPDEERQYFLMFIAQMREWENIHYQYRNGLFDDDEFEAELEAWQFVLNTDANFEKIWCSTRRNFSAPFIKEIEALVETVDCATD